MTYNERNSHPRDPMIEFDEDSHVYRHHGCEFESVTTLVDEMFEQFDAEYWAARKATSFKSKEQILAEWEAKGKAARDLGTNMHEHIEGYYLGNEPDDYARTDRTFANFLRFATERKLHPYRTEWRIYIEDFKIAGTLDFLDCHDGHYEIWDWKRSTKIVDNRGQIMSSSYGKTAHYPIAHVPDTAFHHYALQLSIYRYILEQKYGIVTEGAHLGVFHETFSRPWVVDVPYLRDEVIAVLNYRSGK